MDKFESGFARVLTEESNDKNSWIGIVAHAIEYTLLGLTAGRAMIWKQPSNFRLIIIVFSLCCLYALSDEIHQIFVPGRIFQIQDLFSDATGIILGLSIYSFIQSRKRNHLLRVNAE